MKKKIKNEMSDELRPEYDLGKLLKGGVRGKYTERYRAGTNLVLLDPDIAKKLDALAKSKRVRSQTLVNKWLREKIAEQAKA